MYITLKLKENKQPNKPSVPWVKLALEGLLCLPALAWFPGCLLPHSAVPHRHLQRGIRSLLALQWSQYNVMHSNQKRVHLLV